MEKPSGLFFSLGAAGEEAYSWKESCHRHCQPPHSAKCLCLYFLLSLIFFVLVAAVLLVVFVTRLKKPTFILQSIQMDKSFSLRSSPSNRSGDNTTASCSVASLMFAAQNSNGIGIRYSAADLGVSYANESVGAMDVPVFYFYQPPRSSNVTVLMHALFEESNVSRLVVSELSAQRKLVEIRIAGRIDATTHIMNFPLPKIQFTLDCTIATNYTDIMLREGIESLTTRKALQLSALPHVSQKCSVTLDMRSRGRKTKLADLGC